VHVARVPIEEPTNLGVESRQKQRSSLFLAAMMRVEAHQAPVKVRNMSLRGAMVDTTLSPPAGRDVQLIPRDFGGEHRIV
jgi:hypothetical protein